MKTDTEQWEICTFLLRKQPIGVPLSYGAMMRRRVKGKWVYRSLTEAEESQWVTSQSQTS